jgi:DNA-binding IclR family transcriptional regulator
MPRPAPSITRVVKLLNLLGERSSEFLTLSEISRRLDLNKATAHGILSALTESGYVLRHADDKGYAIGPALVTVARATVADQVELTAMARPAMEALSESSGGQCAATTVVGHEVVTIAVTGSPAGGPGTFVGQRGRLLPPFGVVFVAWGDEARVESWLGGEPLTPDERARMNMLLEIARERGFSVSSLAKDRERLEEAVTSMLINVANKEVEATLLSLMAELARSENELTEIDPKRSYRIRQISAPVFDAHGAVRLGLTLTGLPMLTGAQIRDRGYALATAANQITQQIAAGALVGGPGGAPSSTRAAPRALIADR